MNGSFTTIDNLSSSDGEAVSAPLVQGSDGNLYGVASSGGNAGLCGTIFKLSTSGQLLWTYLFPCGMGGLSPVGPLAPASDGNLYGTTASGGNSANCGTIFKLDQQGKVATLFAFQYIPNGCEPYAGLIQGTDGNLYGATVLGGKSKVGTLFQLSLGGTLKVIYNFGAIGNKPEA